MSGNCAICKHFKLGIVKSNDSPEVLIHYYCEVKDRPKGEVAFFDEGNVPVYVITNSFTKNPFKKTIVSSGLISRERDLALLLLSASNFSDIQCDSFEIPYGYYLPSDINCVIGYNYGCDKKYCNICDRRVIQLHHVLYTSCDYFEPDIIYKLRCKDGKHDDINILHRQDFKEFVIISDDDVERITCYEEECRREKEEKKLLVEMSSVDKAKNTLSNFCSSVYSLLKKTFGGN